MSSLLRWTLFIRQNLLHPLALINNIGSKGSWLRYTCHLTLIFVWILVFYVTSAASGIWNKVLVDGGSVSPTVLTLLHLVVSILSDYWLLTASDPNETEGGGSSATAVRELPSSFASQPPSPPASSIAASPPPLNFMKLLMGQGRHSLWEVISTFGPISLFVVLAKLTTFISYQHVSVALSHTAKASEPIFNALVAALLFREYQPTRVYASLVPIALGVLLASVTDWSYNTVGFLWAILSALMKVLQNVYTKRVMTSRRFSFVEIHLFCGAASLLVLAPIMALQAAASDASLFSHFPLLSLCTCSALQYIASVASYMVLHLVAHLTYTIINVAKRLVIIISGAALDPNGDGLRPANIVGVLISCCGILAYHLAMEYEEGLGWLRGWGSMAGRLCGGGRPSERGGRGEKEGGGGGLTLLLCDVENGRGSGAAEGENEVGMSRETELLSSRSMNSGGGYSEDDGGKMDKRREATASFSSASTSTTLPPYLTTPVKARVAGPDTVVAAEREGMVGGVGDNQSNASPIAGTTLSAAVTPSSSSFFGASSHFYRQNAAPLASPMDRFHSVYLPQSVFSRRPLVASSSHPSSSASSSSSGPHPSGGGSDDVAGAGGEGAANGLPYGEEVGHLKR